jgi:hypothetical protein
MMSPPRYEDSPEESNDVWKENPEMDGD